MRPSAPHGLDGAPFRPLLLLLPLLLSIPASRLGAVLPPGAQAITLRLVRVEGSWRWSTLRGGISTILGEGARYVVPRGRILVVGQVRAVLEFQHRSGMSWGIGAAGPYGEPTHFFSHAFQAIPPAGAEGPFLAMDIVTYTSGVPLGSGSSLDLPCWFPPRAGLRLLEVQATLAPAAPPGPEGPPRESGNPRNAAENRRQPFS